MKIGEHYYWYDYESGGWSQIGEKAHERLTRSREQMQQKIIDHMKATGTPFPPPVITCVTADFPEDNCEFKNLWIESAEGTKRIFTSYFTPAHQEPLIDEYGNKKSN